MLQTTFRTKITILLVSILALLAVPGCDDYNTDVLGAKFSPLNSLVSPFVHAVYVEYNDGGVRIWGPNADLVTAQMDGAYLTITSDDDSLALVVYGNVMGKDTMNLHSGQLKINMDRDFALYLSGLTLHSDQGPAIEVQADEHICYLVVARNSVNHLSDTLYATQYKNGSIQEADGCLFVSGQLYMDGTGTLNIHNVAQPRYDADLGDSIFTHALYARGGLICNYGLTASLTSKYGDAIHTAGAEVKLVKGTWNLYPGRDTINTEEAGFTIGELAKVYVNDSIFTLPIDSIR